MPLYQPISSATALPDGIVAFADLASGVPAALAADDAFTDTYARKAAAWATGVDYAVDELVVDSGTLYRCTTAHTAAGAFDGAKFTAVVGGAAVTIDADGSLVVDGVTVELGTDAEIAAAIAAAAATKLDASARGATNGVASLDGSTLVPTAQLGTGSADGTKVLSGDRSWATAVTLAQSGQTPSQGPVAPATTASVGSLAYAARADHAHASYGLFALFGRGSDGAAVFDGSSAVTGCNRSGSTYTATRDLHFTSAAFSNGVTLNMDGYRLFVRGILQCASGSASITATPITASGTNNSSSGGLTATATYGAGNGRARSLGSSIRGKAGATTAGAAPESTPSYMKGLSLVTGASGNGGSGGSGSGGTGATHGASNVDVTSSLMAAPFAFLGMTMSNDGPNAWLSGANVIGPVCGGPGGASGSGDGANAGGAGGCGGLVVLVNAMVITGAVNITAPGGAGGTPTTGNCGGGGGGTGGVVITNSLDLTGWTGTATAAAGAAGSGVGTGTNGTAGAAGFVQTTTWL